MAGGLCRGPRPLSFLALAGRRGLASVPMDDLDPRMVSVYRKMTSVERVQAGLAATELIRDRLRAHFADVYPDWNESEVEAAVARRLLDTHDRD